MTRLTWWLRFVGVLYVLNGVMMAVVRAPISSAGPAGALDRAAAGEPTARFLVDTWIGFGLEVGEVGIALLLASRVPASARALVWAIIAIEIARGLIYDVYMMAQGYSASVYLPWIGIHSLVIITGVWALRSGYAPASAVPQSRRQP
jgi:hypothetical protein